MKYNLLMNSPRIPNPMETNEDIVLTFKYLFGLPNIPRNPYMFFYHDESILKSKSGNRL